LSHTMCGTGKLLEIKALVIIFVVVPEFFGKSAGLLTPALPAGCRRSHKAANRGPTKPADGDPKKLLT